MKTKFFLTILVLFTTILVFRQQGVIFVESSTAKALAPNPPVPLCYTRTMENESCGCEVEDNGVTFRSTPNFDFQRAGRFKPDAVTVVCTDGLETCTEEGLVAVVCPECDSDTDGALATGCGGNDCKDNDDDIRPGLPENCTDGKDNDCDGYTDNLDFECWFTGCEDSGGSGGGNFDPNDPPLECPPGSPILLDVQGDGFALTDAAGGVNFDLRPNGNAERIGWTAANSDDAFLVLDRNGNGTIDNGQELFGNYTPQPDTQQAHGFIALAEFDKPVNGGNGDDRITSSDTIFCSLQLWQDVNHNGFSEAGELFSLPALGVTSFDLDYKEKKKRDAYGNWFRYRAKVYDAQGAQLGRWAWDVFFVNP